MSDYISRDELLELYAPDPTIPNFDALKLTVAAARQNVLDMPAADVEAVVHCGNCKYLEFSDFYGECGRSYFGIVQPWDYCSRGARRNKEDNT